ncbi:hypothetical protein HDU98_010744 [Podochytrium sp. JEL0797]|nr:hypothetical protein HDU98_010744 [Podochytrium sp. JEL0797]
MDKFVIRTPSGKAAAAAAAEPAAEPAPAEASDSEDDQSSPATITSLKRKLAAITKENAHLAAENARLKKQCKDTTKSPAKPATKPKTPGEKKKLFAKWVKGLARECGKAKMQGYCGVDYQEMVVKETIAWTYDEFAALFMAAEGPGELIQPTKTNKPTSIITIVRFASFEDVQKLIGADALDATTEFSIPIWRNRSFQKAVKVGEARCSIQSMDAVFSKSKMSVELKFQMVGESDY